MKSIGRLNLGNPDKERALTDLFNVPPGSKLIHVKYDFINDEYELRAHFLVPDVDFVPSQQLQELLSTHETTKQG